MKRKEEECSILHQEAETRYYRLWGYITIKGEISQVLGFQMLGDETIKEYFNSFLKEAKVK